MTAPKIFNYDVAISFASEDRDFAKFIADRVSPRFRVFFDEYERVDLWGSDLSESLPSKYVASRYCVILQSREYLEKAWTILERQAIIFEFLKRRGTDYVLPIRVRGCAEPIPGLSGLIGYVTAHSIDDWESITDLILLKLERME
jgi:hypothetical protein